MEYLKKKITFMMNNIILNSSYIGLFILAKDFSGNKNIDLVFFSNKNNNFVSTGIQ
jgi:hypothetical protein